MQTKRRFLVNFPYVHAMLYAKMFYGYDILKHGLHPHEEGVTPPLLLLHKQIISFNPHPHEEGDHLRQRSVG